MKVTIKAMKDGYFEIWHKGTTGGEMTWGEVVEQLYALFEPSKKLYPMKTPEQWEEADNADH